MASVTKQTGKPRKDPKTGRELKPVVSYKIRWYYPVPNGKAEEQVVTWRDYSDAKQLKGIVEARGGRVRKTDPDVLDRSIITGKRTREDNKPSGPTVPQLIDEFMEQKVRDGIKVTTLKTYGGANRAGIVREFWADEYVSQLDEDKVRALLDHVTGKLGLAPKAPLEFTSILLNFAVKREYLTRNPAKLVKVPRRLFRPRFLAHEEFELLLSHETDEEYRLLLMVAWESGLRLGEIIALEREDITVLNGRAYITVNKAIATDKQNRLIVQTPKSGKDRMVVIPMDLAERLLAPGRHPSRIFPARRISTQIMRPQYVTARFKRLRARAMGVVLETGKPNPDHKGPKLTGRRPRFHDLRHSHASNLLGAGVDMFVVSKRLGHSTITITVNIYGHLGKAADDAVIAALAAHRPANAFGQYQAQAISDAA